MYIYIPMYIHRGQQIDNVIKTLTLTSETRKLGFPGDSVVKNPPAKKAGDMRSIPGLRRSPGEGYGNRVQYSCLENPMDRKA